MKDQKEYRKIYYINNKSYLVDYQKWYYNYNKAINGKIKKEELPEKPKKDNEKYLNLHDNNINNKKKKNKEPIIEKGNFIITFD